MWEPEPHSIIQAAEKAAEAGNYASAEHLLRDAARLQEASLGPRHPDLANTLNNLGIVCERTGKPDEAEQYFRRAVSIARTSLAPDHPFIATSQQNLRDFCETRGKQVELPAPAPEPEAEPAPEPVQEITSIEPEDPEVTQPAPPPEVPKPAQEVTNIPAVEAAPPPEVEAAPPAERPQESAIDPEEDPEVTSRKFFFRVALGALGPIAMLMVILAAGLPRLGAPELTALSPARAPDSPRAVAPPPVSAPVEALPTPDEPTTPATTGPEDDDAVSGIVTTASTPAQAVVVRANLCADLDDWSCDPADRPVPSGPLFFYTQITAQRVTTIRHRWYQDAQLRQTVELRVQPNRAAGYRTYSRTVINGESAGNWRIEVRGEEGTLLHEERFTVQ